MIASPVSPLSPPLNSKRIVEVKIENYRAYFGQYKPIILPLGENLLIYGENGSGKTSFYKAINNYLSSSVRANLPFVKNRYNLASNGEIEIAFEDFDQNGAKVTGSSSRYSFSSTALTTAVPFIQNAALVKGFLDYRDLLDVYFHKSPNPNLFSLVVDVLLGEYIPIRLGGTVKFRDRWRQIQTNLITNARNKRSIIHRQGLRDLINFHTHLRGTLDDVFLELNRFLDTYFSDIRLRINYQLPAFSFRYGHRKVDWYTHAELTLNVIKDNSPIQGDYSDILNEARLSAFAICLYLASLKCNPANVELKILYLDDIFIGLDGSNRIQIMDIINNEFADYQIFMSTYDRYTYEFAKRYFKSKMPDRWLTTEFYVGKHDFSGISFDKPIIVNNMDNYGKAMFYLHHTVDPDYPAAANYFRKYAEEILQRYIPSHERRNKDYVKYEGYMLKDLVSSAFTFFRKIDADDSLLHQLKNLLPTILHPLSHFNLSSPVYKKELIDVQKCLADLEAYLANLSSTYRPFIRESDVLELHFNNINSVGTYVIRAMEPIYLKRDSLGHLSLSRGKCFVVRTREERGGQVVSSFRIPKNNARFTYTSIENAYNKIFDFVVTQSGWTSITKAADYTNEFILERVGRTLHNVLVW